MNYTFWVEKWHCFFTFLVEEKKENTLKSVVEAKGKVKNEIVALKNKLKLARETISIFKEEIAKSQDNQYVGVWGGYI